MLERFEIEHNESGIALVKDTKTKKFLVVQVIRRVGVPVEVQSVMPGDLPESGGVWRSTLSDGGIAYVANLYSKGYAQRKYREFVEEEMSFQQSS